MVCTSVTVVAAKPIISNLVSSQVTGQLAINVSWNQDITGQIRVLVDNTAVWTVSLNAGAQNTTIQNVSVGTHNVCVEAV
jgi:hypothetical protein